MADPSEAELQAAEIRGRQMLEAEPRASDARYDRSSGRLILDLVNGCSYAFPVRLVQDLSGASPDDLSGVEVDGLGFNLHWPALDCDLYVPALVSGLFGTRAWMKGESVAPAGKTTSLDKAGSAHARAGRSRKLAGH